MLARITRGLICLGPCAGVLLVQLPPTAEFDQARLAYFLQCVPISMRVCVEFRHASWHQATTFDLLQEYGAAYCVMSGANLPCILRATAGFVYVRLHGPDHHHMYAGSYSDDELRWWSGRIGEWKAMGRDVFVYFNNDGGGNAVRNARMLTEIIRAERRAFPQSPVVSVLVRQLTDGLRVFSHVDTDGDAPRWSDASGCTTAQRQPVINAIELTLSMPDRPLGRDSSLLIGAISSHRIRMRKWANRYASLGLQ